VEVFFSFDGLHDVIKQKDPKKGSTIKIDEVLFHYRGNKERVGTVTIEANTVEEAEKESRYLIDKALGKICFAFNTEASISLDGYYLIDLTKNQNLECICGSLTIGWSYIMKEDSKITLAKMNSIKPDKKGILDLALAYCKLGEDRNPLRIECFFSSMTVLIRDLWINELSKNDDVDTKFLKRKIKLILKDKDPTIFDEAMKDVLLLMEEVVS
jgi:hypothetical protein